MHAPEKNAVTARLHALIASEWEYQLEHSPIYASVLGDRRWNGRWNDLGLDAIEADHQHNLQVLAELEALDRSRLPTEEQLTYDLFRHDYTTWIEEHRFKTHLLPVDQLGGIPESIRRPPGIQTAYQLADTLRFETERDYEDWLVRLGGFGTFVDQLVTLLREGMREGLVHPQAVLRRVPPQLEWQLVDDPTESGFYGPFKRFPAGFSPEARERLALAARSAIAEGVVPALTRFHRFFTQEYLPAAPEQVGSWQWPRGDELYAFLARKFTTTRLTPDEIHELGLAEVQRIRGEMDAVRERTGFQGSRQDFFRFLRGDARFYCESGEELLRRYRGLCERIDPRLAKLFKTLPRQPYVIEPIPEAMAPDLTTGFYLPGASDGSRPGAYLVNLYRPETRPVWEMVPLTLHEAMPGHHLQIALAAEQEHMPAFRRHGGYVAYVEGWALYCETLGDELGLYDDPYDQFGQRVYDMWRAVRLVVDTGLHARRWSRQQALDFFLEHSPRQELDVINEVDRYIAWPGQALAYKIGQLKLRELRTRAEQALGERFDPREFHDVVLLDGPLPLELLEQRVEAWMARGLTEASG